jgi:hypothetical protein
MLALLLQFFFSEQIGKQCGAQVTLTRGRKDNHNILIGKGFIFLKFERCRNGAPEEIPARMPSSSIRRRAVEMASSLVMVTTLSISFRSRLPGMKPAPIP